MTEKTLEEQISEGQAVKEMMSHSEGWKVVKAIIMEIQERAFNEWADLPLDAPTEKQARLKCTKAVLTDLMNEINATVKLGEEAAQIAEERKNSDIREAMEVSETSTDYELEKLMKPQSFLEKIFGREPETASQSKGPLNGQPK
jgi:hypothetical protein